MIQKTNNISFKGIYPLPSMLGINIENYTKLIPVVRMEDQFPANDIFLGVTPKNQLVIEVREKDMTKELLNEEVLNSSKDLSTQELIGLTSFIQNLKNTYHENHPESLYKTHTKNTITQMSMFDMALAVYNAVQNFNEKFGNKPN